MPTAQCKISGSWASITMECCGFKQVQVLTLSIREVDKRPGILNCGTGMSTKFRECTKTVPARIGFIPGKAVALERLTRRPAHWSGIRLRLPIAAHRQPIA